MDDTLINLFEHAGLSDKEARVYLALLKLGQATVVQISRQSKLKRPIIYVTIESLIDNGYVSRVPNKKVNTYAVGDPAVISAKLTSTAKGFAEMLPYLQNLSDKSGNRPRISYHETEDAIWNIYKETSHYKNVLIITSYARLKQNFPKATERWLQDCEKGVYTLNNWKHLIPNNHEDIAIAKRLVKIGQNIRVVGNEKVHTLDLALYNNKTSITSIEEEPFIVVVESAALTAAMCAMFEMIWTLGKKIK